MAYPLIPVRVSAATAYNHMISELPAEGLISGPSVEEVRAGTDVSTFRHLLANQGALALFDYWCRLVHEGGVAIKHLFDPTEVPSALSSIYLEEYDWEYQQSRMRLMGETLKAQWSGSVVGLVTDDYVVGSVNALWKQSDQLVYFEKRAAILIYSLEYIDRSHCTLIDLALPMDNAEGKMFAIGYAWQRR